MPDPYEVLAVVEKHELAGMTLQEAMQGAATDLGISLADVEEAMERAVNDPDADQ